MLSNTTILTSRNDIVQKFFRKIFLKLHLFREVGLDKNCVVELNLKHQAKKKKKAP